MTNTAMRKATHKKQEMKIPATRLRRMLGFGLDLLVMDIMVFTPFTSVLFEPLPSSWEEVSTAVMANQDISHLLTTLMVLWSLYLLVYFTLMEYITGQTVGELIMKVTVESKQGELGFLQALLNNLFVLPLFPLILLWILDPLFLAVRNETLSQKIAQTNYVVRYEL